MKFGRIVPHVNTHRLTESDLFLFDFIILEFHKKAELPQR